MTNLDNLLLAMTMFALGFIIHFKAVKQAGTKPLILTVIMFVWLTLGGAVINVLVDFI